MSGLRVAGLAAAILLAGLTFSPTTGRAGEIITQPAVVELTTWRAVIPKVLRSPAKGPIIGGHHVGIFIEGGYCLGGPKPEYDHVTLQELPRTEKRPFKAAVITAYRRWPEYSFTPPAGPDYGKCLRLDRTIFRRVPTKRPASGLRLYDGYFSPPRRVWPLLRK